MNNQQNKSHASRNALIIIGIIIFLVVGLPLLFVWLLLPSSSQMKRLDASFHQQYESSLSPIPPDDYILLEESDLEVLMNKGVSAFMEEAQDVHFAGIDLVVDEDHLSLLFAVTSVLPWNKEKDELKLTPFAGEVFFEVINTEPSLLSVQLKKIKIGKLGIPVAALMKLQFLKDSLNNSLSFLPGTSRVDLKNATALINLNDVADEWIPGALWTELSLHPEKIRLHFILPEEEQNTLKELCSNLGGYMPSFHASLLPVLPAESGPILKSCETVMLRITSSQPDSLNPLSGVFSIARSYIDLWLSLSEDDQEKVLEQSVKFMESNPEAMEGIVQYIETFEETVESGDGSTE
jgi:hypothetical protein